MADGETAPLGVDPLEERIAALLADPAHAGNPLRAVLAELLAHSAAQRERLERLVRISDGFHRLERASSLTLAQRYDRQLRRIEKIARISDRYQHDLRALTESLKEAALRDALTGLGNRRFLMERLREETERVARGGGGYALAITDVDHFKSINDRHGHEGGDLALCRIADAIRTSVREYDLCGRWGGEEFLIMLPETQLDAAISVIERVRVSIAAIMLDAQQPAALSASFGLTTYRAGESYSDTLNRADTALFRAKANGRNRTECA